MIEVQFIEMTTNLFILFEADNSLHLVFIFISW